LKILMDRASSVYMPKSAHVSPQSLAIVNFLGLIL